MRIKKDIYEMLKKRLSTMLNNSEKTLTGFATELNLKKISTDEFDQKKMDWENELFAMEFQVWLYDIQKAIETYNRKEKEFIRNYRMGFIDLINLTPASKKKLDFKLEEKIKKLTKEVTEGAYSEIIRTCKNVPVHGIDRNKFPIRDIKLNEDL